SSTTTNIGSLENRGFEAQVRGYVLDGAFKWHSDINYSTNKSKILYLGEGGSDIYGPAPAANIVNQSANIMRVGAPFGAFYGYEVIGLIQSTDFDSEGNPTFAVHNA